MKRISIHFSKGTGAILFCATLLISLLLSLLTLSSPSPKNRENDFSSERAFCHIEAIAPLQHSVFDTIEIEDVRNYIEETLDAFEHVKWARVKHASVDVVNQKTHTKEPIDIQNIYAEIPGKSEICLLIMAHYDSSPYKEKYGVGTAGSYGAADDGYGVATMLEIMRILNDYASNNELVNGVKFAFTDAEEVGLYGATALTKEFSYWLQDVNILLNLEARGNKGPLYMFQTGNYNYKLIKFYSQTRLPFSLSVAADVYKYLPNDTDFTPFLKLGYPGLNFATLNSLKFYHTPLDNLQNSDKATLQFYGEQILPLVLEYIGNPQYSARTCFVSNEDTVFFTLFPGFLMYYSHTVSWIIIFLATLAAALIAFFALRKRAVSWKKTLLALGIWMLFLICAALTGLLLAKGIGAVTHNRFQLLYMPYVPFDGGFVLIFALLVMVAGFFVFKRCRKLECSPNDILSGSILLFLILTLLSAFLLHGATILFVWPTIFMTALLEDSLLDRQTSKWQIIKNHLVNTLAVLTTSIMFIILIYSLFLALTFGALAVILLFTAIYTCALVSYGFSQPSCRRF